MHGAARVAPRTACARSTDGTVACATSTSASGVKALPLGLLIAPRAETTECGSSSIAPPRCERCGAFSFASDLDVHAESVSGAVAGVRKLPQWSCLCAFCGAEAAQAPPGAGVCDSTSRSADAAVQSAATRRFTLRERQPSAAVKASADTHFVFVVDATMTKARLELVAAAIEGALEAMPARSSISLIACVPVGAPSLPFLPLPVCLARLSGWLSVYLPCLCRSEVTTP